MVDGDTCGRSRITCRSLVAHSSISLLYWNATATISGYFRGVGVYPSLLNFAFVTARSEAVTCRPVGRFAREQVFLLPGVYQWMRGGTCACMHDVDGRVSDRAGYFVPPGGGGQCVTPSVSSGVKLGHRDGWRNAQPPPPRSPVGMCARISCRFLSSPHFLLAAPHWLELVGARMAGGLERYGVWSVQSWEPASTVPPLCRTNSDWAGSGVTRVDDVVDGISEAARDEARNVLSSALMGVFHGLPPDQGRPSRSPVRGGTTALPGHPALAPP